MHCAGRWGAQCVERALFVKLGPVLRFDDACDAFLRVPVLVACGGFGGGVEGFAGDVVIYGLQD